MGQNQGHGVSRKNVVTAEDMPSIHGEPSPRDDCSNSLQNCHHCQVLVVLRLAQVIRIGSWENGDGHGDGTEIVKEAQNQPDPPEDNTPVSVSDNDKEG